MGYCVIHIYGKKMEMQAMDVLKMQAKQDNYTRLQLIYTRVSELISEFSPDCFAIEAPFFGKNVQSMLKLGRAQGVAIAAAIGAGLEVCEYSPRKIKQSITGNGNADKDQVWKMLQQLLTLKDTPLKYYDASDALAVAVCHHFQDNVLLNLTKSKPKSWKEYVAALPSVEKKKR